MNRIGTALFGLVTTVFLSACNNPEEILPGERLDLRPGEGVTQNISVPARLGPSVDLASWTHRAGTPSHRIQHAAFGIAPSLIWSADIGQGNGKRHRISADPVAANGQIFTLDSRALVTATSTTGITLWQRDLTPATENSDDASGGGLAVVGGQLFVTTGFGELFALNSADGSVNWMQELEAPATGAPTISNGLLYVVTRNNRGWAIDVQNGRVRWQVAGPASVSGVVGGAGPAVGSGIVVFPFGSATVAAVFPRGGLQLWRGSVAGSRLGSAYAQLSDVSADPVISGNRIYAGNPSGRFVAIDAGSGEQIWTVPQGATGPALVAGGSVFFVTDKGQLTRRRTTSGAHIWSVQLPEFVPARNTGRLRDIYPHFGPVLAGGRLWIASGDSVLRAFDAADGALVFSAAMPAAATTRPIIVGGTMYLVSSDGQLRAFR